MREENGHPLPCAAAGAGFWMRPQLGGDGEAAGHREASDKGEAAAAKHPSTERFGF